MKHTEPLYPNQYYHLYNHAVGRDNFFNNDDNYRYFLKKYTHYIYPICQTLAYGLRSNHFHFLARGRGEQVLFNQAQPLQPGKVLAQAEFSNPELARQQFSNLFNSYTKAYNKVYQRQRKSTAKLASVLASSPGELCGILGGLRTVQVK